MNTPIDIRSRGRLYALLTLVALIATYICFDHYQSQKQALAAAIESLQSCERQSREILELRDAPTIAVSELEDLGGLTARISAAQEKAGFEPQSVDLVDPRRPTRIEESSYRQRPVAIDLRGLSLTQIVKFIDALTDQAKGIWVSEVRLTPARQDATADAEMWNVELVLTQLNYSPKSG
ncbi:MAG: hypothetical protein AAFX06_08730 [Planctomycetota bacterium]